MIIAPSQINLASSLILSRDLWRINLATSRTRNKGKATKILNSPLNISNLSCQELLCIQELLIVDITIRTLAIEADSQAISRGNGMNSMISLSEISVQMIFQTNAMEAKKNSADTSVVYSSKVVIRTFSVKR